MTNRRHGYWMLALGAAALCLLPFAARGQTARDTAIAKQEKVATDSIASAFVPQLNKYCATAKPAQYLCLTARPVLSRMLTRLAASESALIATVIAPPPVPTPQPRPDSVSLVLDAGSYASGSYAIEATTTLSAVASVQFIVDGSLNHTESIAKYCLFGGDTTCAAGSLGAGAHTIQAKVLGGFGQIIGQSVVISIVDGSTPAPAPSPTPNPTPGPSGAHPNEPAGFTRVAFQSMDSLSNVYYIPSDPGGGGRLSIIRDTTNPGSSPNVAQLLFPAGFGSGSAPESMYPTGNYPSTPKELYVHFFVKLSSNWVGNETAGVNKVLFITFGYGGHDPVGSAVMSLLAIDDQPLQPVVSPEGLINMVNTGDGYSGGPSQNLGVNQFDHSILKTTGTRGIWHRFEAHIILNDPITSSNGGVEWWWDGVLYGQYLNRMQWSQDPAGPSRFQNVVWSPTYGGGAGQTLTANQFMYLKDLYISGK